MRRDESLKAIIVIDDCNMGKFTAAVRRVATGGAMVRTMSPGLMGTMEVAPVCRAYVFAPGVEERFPIVRALMRQSSAVVWELESRAQSEYATLFGEGSADAVWRQAIDSGVVTHTPTVPPRFIYSDELIGVGVLACLERLQNNPELMEKISGTIKARKESTRAEVDSLFTEAVALEVITKKNGRHRFEGKTLPAKKADVISLLERDSALLGAVRRAVG